MKTALDWLIEQMPYEFRANHTQELFRQAKEKEKEHIVNAFEVGYKSCDIDEAFEINRKLASGEQHYNKTYN